MSKTVYQIDPETGELRAQFPAQDIPGIDYRGPQFIDTPPPAAKAGHARVFKNGVWGQVEDHRGTVVYGGDDGREPIEISGLGPLADFGTPAPAPLTAEEQAGELAAAKATLITAAEAEQKRRQESSFVYEGKRVRVSEADLEAMSRFGHLVDARAADWPQNRAWVSPAPGYDTVLLRNETAANKLKTAMFEHVETFIVPRLVLSARIAAAADLDALAAIDVTDDAVWQFDGYPDADSI